MSPSLRRRLVAIAVGSLTITGGSLVLGACGGGTAAGPVVTANTTAAPGGGAGPSGGTGPGGRRGGFDPAQLAQVRMCLSAAGITLPTPRPFPSGSARPSRGARPSGGFGRGGGFGGVLQSPEAQAALKACGIALPTRRAGRSGAPGGAAPSASTASTAAS